MFSALFSIRREPARPVPVVSRRKAGLTRSNAARSPWCYRFLKWPRPSRSSVDRTINPVPSPGQGCKLRSQIQTSPIDACLGGSLHCNGAAVDVRTIPESTRFARVIIRGLHNMRELNVFEAKRISGAGLVIAGGISGNTGTSGNNGVGVSIGVGKGASVTIDGQPVSPTSSSKNGVGVVIGRYSSSFKFKF